MAEVVQIWWDAAGVARGVQVTSSLGPPCTYTIHYDQWGAQVRLAGQKLVATAGYVAQLGCYRFTAVGFTPALQLGERRWATLADAAAGAAHAHAMRMNEELASMSVVVAAIAAAV
ncbi:hypothetical protein ABT294_11225 [Nonomuraea sp. NPDC000554]|uniref:hypothetical protein n=1 Tax=Nonomuraea sp. NPDC000554 TaxID=3154259 RepID=UPI0033333BD8